MGYLIRKSIGEVCRSFCEAIDSLSGASKLRKILAKEKVVPGYIRKLDGSWAEDSDEVGNILMDSHFPDSVEFVGSLTEETTAEWNKVGLPLDECARVVSEERLKWAIFSFEPYKSARVDKIFPALLKNAFDCIKARLSNIFISSLNLGFIPHKWRDLLILISASGWASTSCVKHNTHT